MASGSLVPDGDWAPGAAGRQALDFAADVTARRGTGGVGAARGDDVAGRTPSSLREDDIDRIVDAIEERVLAEIERRGGRFAGRF